MYYFPNVVIKLNYLHQIAFIVSSIW